MRLAQFAIGTLFLVTHIVTHILTADTALAQSQKQTSKSKSQSTKPALDAQRMPEASSASEIRRGLYFDAFLDVEARIANKKDRVADMGVTLNDGALYLSKDFSDVKAVIDLPFYSSLAGGSNQFEFASNQAQGYFQLTDGALVVTLGQYDTFFGVEANDSKDRFFANVGAIKSYLIPLTHSGAQVAYTADKILMRAQIATPNGEGPLNEQNPEFAGQVRFDQAPIFGAVGLSIYEDRTVAADKQGLLVNIMGGTTIDRLDIAGEIDFKRTAGTDKTATGFGVFGVYKVESQLDLGGRLEYLKDPVISVPNGGTGVVDSVLALSAGPAYQYHEDLSIRGDFSLASVKGPADTETIFGVTISVVADL